MSRLTQRHTQPPSQLVIGALSLGVKQPEHEADHPPPSSGKVKNVWNYTSTPVFTAWCLSTETSLPFTFPCCGY